ncbi:MAG: IPT/TIG domain-containing protein [Candidatus Acidiferrum sp.]
MAHLRRCAPALLLGFFLLGSTGCGGGSSSIQQPPPPPPQPDFSIGFSQNSVNLQQDATSSAIDLSVNPLNGFTGSVQIALSSLPAGVVANPPSPFSIPAGSSTPVLFSAAANATAGNYTIMAEGSSGSLSHPANLALTIQSAVVANLPRTAYARTDSVPAMDDPSGEFHHRHIAYDPVHQLVFVANRAMNRVEIFSSTTAARVGQVSVPGASSADLSADGKTIWVGTVTEQVAAIDTTSLQVKARYELTGLQPLPNTLFDRPEELLSLSNGNLMMRLRQSQTGEALLALWAPSSNTLTNLTSSAPQLFQNGLGSMARSGDRTKVLVAASDASGQVVLFNASGNVLAGPHGLGSGTIPLVAANPDGSKFAVVFVSSGTTQVFLLDGSLNQVGAYLTTAVNGMVFSRDGQFLYVSENAGSPPVVTVLNGNSLNLIGQVPDLWLAGRRTEIEDVDATNLLFGVANRGLGFVDAATPSSLPLTVPSFAASPIAQPAEGPNAGGTVTALSGQNFSSSAQLEFGTQFAANPSVVGPTQITATSPPNAAAGAINITAYFPSGWLALAPDAFSYGPQILRILPNAGAQAGGDTVQIYGFGFGGDPTKVTVTIGGASATVQKTQNVTAIAPSLGLDATYPFSLECITLQTPPGTAGKADLVLTSPAGSITAAKTFQYLQSENFYAKPSFDKFVLYDQSRQWLYLSDIDHLDVFDLAAAAFHGTAIEPPGGPPPTSELRGLALTPDSTQLVAADFGAQNIYLLDPDNGAGTSVAVGGVAGFSNSGPARVAATSTQNVFVGLSAESGSSGACTSCLGQLNLTASPPTIEPAAQPEITSITGAPLVQSNSTGSQVFVAFATAPGGPLALWNAASPGQFSTFTANDAATDIGTAADGTMFALQANGTTEIRAADLSLAAVPANPELLQIPGRVQVPGLTLHPSGALVYQPFLTGPAGNAGVKGGVDILDAHSGALRLRILLPQQFMTDIDGLHGSFLAIDENGQRLFAITSTDGTAQNAGITIVTLANVPLGIGTLTPATGPAAGGTQITIRGSGFQTGTTVTIGGINAPATFKDMNTLIVLTPATAAGAQRVTITNPDGESTSLDATFTSN